MWTASILVVLISCAQRAVTRAGTSRGGMNPLFQDLYANMKNRVADEKNGKDLIKDDTSFPALSYRLIFRARVAVNFSS